MLTYIIVWLLCCVMIASFMFAIGSPEMFKKSGVKIETPKALRVF